MLVKNEIKNTTYQKLIKYAFSKCDAVMFIFRKDGFSEKQIKQLNKKSEQIQKNFSKFELKKRNGSHWVFSKVGYAQLGITEYKDPENFDELFEILFYKTSSKMNDYLLTNQNLYKWLNPEYPEDISFFKNGYCWLYSVAHESLCDIYCESEEEYEYLKSIGIEFLDKKFIPTSNRDLYYESYNNSK